MKEYTFSLFHNFTRKSQNVKNKIIRVLLGEVLKLSYILMEDWEKKLDENQLPVP